MRTPRGLNEAGKRLWRAVTGRFDLAEHELLLLQQACRTSDTLDALQKEIEARGVVVESAQGPRTNPAVVEARQQRVVLGRLLHQLDVPAEVVAE